MYFSGYSPSIAACFNRLPYVSPPKQAKRALTLKSVSWVSHKYQPYPEIVRAANKREISWLLMVENVLLLKPTKEYDLWGLAHWQIWRQQVPWKCRHPCQAARRHIADESNLRSVMCNWPRTKSMVFVFFTYNYMASASAKGKKIKMSLCMPPRSSQLVWTFKWRQKYLLLPEMELWILQPTA